MLTIQNAHVSSCGSPPNFDQLPQDYIGYFENEYREQFVFVFDKHSRIGTLYGGDAGWENAYRISGQETVAVYLNGAERAWLTLCWTMCHRNIGLEASVLEFGEPFR